MRTSLGRAALAGLMIFVSSVLLIRSANASESSILEPASGAWLGQFYGAGNLAQNTAKLGLIPRVHLTYYKWTDDWTGSVTQADLAAGRIPLVNWEPHNIDFKKIIDGPGAPSKLRLGGVFDLGRDWWRCESTPPSPREWNAACVE